MQGLEHHRQTNRRRAWYRLQMLRWRTDWMTHSRYHRMFVQKPQIPLINSRLCGLATPDSVQSQRENSGYSVPCLATAGPYRCRLSPAAQPIDWDRFPGPKDRRRRHFRSARTRTSRAFLEPAVNAFAYLHHFEVAALLAPMSYLRSWVPRCSQNL